MPSVRLVAVLLLLSQFLLSLVSPSQCARSFSTARASSSTCSGGAHGSAGQFDLYVLSQSWSPQYCSSYGDYPGCQQPTDWQQTNLTLHGLWPQYSSEEDGYYYPQCCPSQYGSSLSQSVVTPVLPELQLYWPNEEDPTGSNLAKSIWAHEWQQHGTCTGLDQADFLSTALAAFLTAPTPSIITDNVGGSASRDDLESAFNGGSPCGSGACLVFLQCDDGGLSQVELCFSPQLQQIQCPADVTSATSRCADGAVNIAAFSQYAYSQYDRDLRL